jgi:Zinc binding domain
VSEAAPISVDSPPCSSESCSPQADAHAGLCPVSESIGLKVDLITVKALLTANALRRLDGKAYRFCPEPDCEVVYFDCEADSIFRKPDLEVRVGQKEADDPMPVCYCFGISVADLRKDIMAAGETNIPAMITAEVRAGHCACEVKNPQGSCCLGNVSKSVQRIQTEVHAETV